MSTKSRTLRHRGLRKTCAQLRDNPEEREKCGKTAKSPFIAAITNEPVSTTNWTVCKLRR